MKRRSGVGGGSSGGPRVLRPEDVADRVQLEYVLMMNGDTGGVANPSSKFRTGTSAPKSVTSSLSRKEGLLRRVIYGGRVESTARCVISPAPAYFDTDEIGLPPCITRTITRPITVTVANLATLQALVAGTDRVRSLVTESGSEISLDGMSLDDRAAIRIRVGWVVHRHLQRGDLVVVNRYPSLHQGSWMTHRVRLIEDEPDFREQVAADPGAFSTIWLPVNATSPYNADFGASSPSSCCSKLF